MPELLPPQFPGLPPLPSGGPGTKPSKTTQVTPEGAAKTAPGDQKTTATTAAEAQDPNILEFFNPDGLPSAIALFVCGVLAVRFVHRLSQRLAERVVSRRLLIKYLDTFFAFGTYTLVTLLAAGSLFQLSSQAIFALSGTIAVTVGFALKDVAASFLAGITILINKPFQVGDRIRFGGFYGEVTEIGLRSVRLVTLDDNLVSVPSNKFLTEAVASANAGELDCMVVLKFYLVPDADHRHAKELINDAVMASKYLYLGKPFVVLVEFVLRDDAKSVVKLTAKAYVYDARYEKAFASDITDRVLVAFRENGLMMP